MDMVDVFNYDDYKEKSFMDMLEDSIFVQLLLLFVQILLLFCKIFISMVRDIMDCLMIVLRRLFIEDGEVMLALEYFLPFIYYMKTD